MNRRRIRKPDRDDIQNARSLRQPLTDAERTLWDHVRNRRLAGYKFRRQHPLGPYCVDFYCAERQLVVEIDGDSHLDRDEHDRRRTRWLEQHGLRVLRFSNEQVELRTADVLEALVKACREGTP